ncbi:SixA phosphatase family protein [Terrimonas alba]|uniref:SixA phosphatase family protein n=1 Tax=Terrimonas alba TaxID=3349636 RepID=UPI0035F26072
MKTLLLVRHAKSSWDDFSINDIDRPLNDRGKKDAPAMAKRLRDKDIKIDAFISSPAKRARKTAEAFAKEYKEEKQNIVFIDELYLASPSTFFDVISKTDDQFKTIAVFSHNDGVTSFANMLTSTRIDNIPTGGVFAVRIKTKHWSDFEKAEKEFWFFESPKKAE